MLGQKLIRLQAQFIKELLSILRDPRSRMVVFIPPLVQLLIFAFAATLEVNNVSIAVVNYDAGRWSTELIERIEKAQFINQVHRLPDAQQAQQQLIEGEVLTVVQIPDDFSRLLSAGQNPAPLQLLVDGRRSNSGQIVVSYLNNISNELSTLVRANSLVAPNTTMVPTASIRHWFNPNLIYCWFIVPGLSGILALFSALLLTALSIARERELGTFDQLLVSPVSTGEIIITKSLPALLIGTLLGLMMIAAGVFLFDIPFQGSFAWLLLSLLFFILSAVGIGLMISAISSTQQQAILGAFAIGVPAVLMSGFATPVENMPLVLQWLAQVIPLTHFLVIVQGSFIKALPTSVIFAHLWPLIVIAAVSLSTAVIFVRGRLN